MNPNFIQLTGYFPANHEILVRISAIEAITDNVTNPNSKGSVVYCGAEFMVRETPEEILKLISGYPTLKP